MLVNKDFSICSLHECNSSFCNERALLTINKEFKQLEISIFVTSPTEKDVLYDTVRFHSQEHINISSQQQLPYFPIGEVLKEN